MSQIIELLSDVAFQNDGISNAKLAAAIVSKKGDILGIGVNKAKTHPLQAKFGTDEYKIFLHAEIAALVDTLRVHPIEKLDKSIVYVVRVKRNGELAMSKPCQGCQHALVNFGVYECHYTNTEGKEVVCYLF